MIDRKTYADPGAEYRGTPFWAWNTGLDTERLKRQIGYFAEMGFGGYYIHSRVGLKEPYMGNYFMEMVGLCLEEGKKKGLITNLYDEDRWPSGYGGGAVTKNPKYRATHLMFTTTPYDERTEEKTRDYQPNFAVGVRTDSGTLLAVYDIVLDEDGFLEKYTVIDPDAAAEGVKWYAYIEENPPHPWYNNGAYVDVLNKEAIDCFILSTHEKYRKLLGDEFGKHIEAIFTDEPHMTFMTNLKTPFDTADQFLPWTGTLEGECRKRYGEDLHNDLPYLFWESRNDTRKVKTVRYSYHRILADLFEEAYAANIGSWCRTNSIHMTGHYLYEETLFMQNRSNGDLMRLYRHMDVPGMDLLQDEIALTTAKQVQSVVRQYGKKDAMSEQYGVTNWAFDFRDYLFQSHWQAALGITKRVPHLSLMSLKGEAKRDFPASIFYQAPWYKKTRILEDHFARINYLLKKGKPVVHVAVLHPLESYWVLFGPESQTGDIRGELDRSFGEITKTLLTGGIDFDFLDEGLLEELYKGGKRFGYMEYEIILIPKHYSMRGSTQELLRQYSGSGGQVIFLEEKGENDPDIGRVISSSPYELLREMETVRDIKICDLSGHPVKDYIYQLREEKDMCILFLASVEKDCNADLPPLNHLSVEVKGKYSIYKADTMNGAIRKVDYVQNENSTTFYVDMYKHDAGMFLLDKSADLQYYTSVISEEKVIPSQMTDVPDEVEYIMEEPNVALLDQAFYSINEGPLRKKEELLRIDERLRKECGFYERHALMAQPYVRTKDNSQRSCRLYLRFEFESKTEFEDVCLAMEEADQAEVQFNGRQVEISPCGWYIDEDIQKIRLGTVKAGKNLLEIKILYNEESALENMYLLGEFAVTVQGRSFILEEKRKRIRFGNIVGQGLDFYGGNVRYRFKVNCKNGEIGVRIPKYRGACVGVVIDGEETCIISAPYEVIRHNLVPGIHQIELVLYGNRYNTLSHLHDLNDCDEKSSFPRLWRTKGNCWQYEYNLKPAGILVQPQIKV